MKNFTEELKNILKEDPGAPIMSPDQILSRTNTIVILTNDAPRELLALAGPTRKAILLNFKPLMITFPDQRGVYKVEPDDIVFESHHTGRDVTEVGSEETDYEKFFAQAMKKFGVSSPIELSPEDTKKFFDYVDKNWAAEEESDGSREEAKCSDHNRQGDEPSLIVPNEDVSTGKVGKKDKGSYQHAYKLALKKYKIHSADELDTPAERKGFTAYVDRLWKGGEVKDHALEYDMTEIPKKSRSQKDRERIKKLKRQQAKQKERKRDQEQKTTERERDADQRKKDAAKRIDKSDVRQQGSSSTKKSDPPKPSPDPDPPAPVDPPAPPVPPKPKRKKRIKKKSAFLQRLSKGMDYDAKEKVVGDLK